MQKKSLANQAFSFRFGLGFRVAISAVSREQGADEAEHTSEDGACAVGDLFCANIVDRLEEVRAAEPEDASDHKQKSGDAKAEEAKLSGEDAADKRDHRSNALEDKSHNEKGHGGIALATEHHVEAGSHGRGERSTGISRVAKSGGKEHQNGNDGENAGEETECNVEFTIVHIQNLPGINIPRIRNRSNIRV